MQPDKCQHIKWYSFVRKCRGFHEFDLFLASLKIDNLKLFLHLDSVYATYIDCDWSKGWMINPNDFLFMVGMNRGRGGSGTYQTMQLSSQNKDNANSLSCVGSSKSMPRSCSHSSSSCRCDASMGRRGRAIEGSVKERCLKKTNSYLCINRNGGADCEGCFHQLEDAAKKGVKFKSKSGEAHRSNAQRPRSFHISSCYKDPAYHHQLENDHYLKSQSDWTAVKTYGGHGGFDYDSSLVSAHNSSSYNSFPRLIHSFFSSDSAMEIM